jgi:hypothetical protein
MDIGKSFSFVFEDKKWIEKVLIGGILMLVPILGSILMLGYGVELVRNVRKHDPEPLPEWDEWGTKITEGLKLFILTFLWALPLFILTFLLILPAAIMGNSDSGSAIASIFSLCFSCFAAIYAIIVWLATPGITIKFAETGNFSDGLKFGEILNFTKKNLGQIIIAIIVIWLVYMVAGFLGSLLCLVGLFFTMFWASLVQYHIIGQIGLEAQKTERPLETLSAEAPAAELPETAVSDEDAPSANE